MKRLKTVQAFERPFVIITDSHETWVSVESLCEYLGLDFPDQVKKLTGRSSLRELGISLNTVPESKILVDNGKQYLCIPLEDVSLFAATTTLEDLAMMDNQRHCRDDLPQILASM